MPTHSDVSWNVEVESWSLCHGVTAEAEKYPYVSLSTHTKISVIFAAYTLVILLTLDTFRHNPNVAYKTSRSGFRYLVSLYAL